MRKIFANHLSEKRFLSKTRKELLQLNNKKTNASVKKMGKGLD